MHLLTFGDCLIVASIKHSEMRSVLALYSKHKFIECVDEEVKE